MIELDMEIILFVEKDHFKYAKDCSIYGQDNSNHAKDISIYL